MILGLLLVNFGWTKAEWWTKSACLLVRMDGREELRTIKLLSLLTEAGLASSTIESFLFLRMYS